MVRRRTGFGFAMVCAGVIFCLSALNSHAAEPVTPSEFLTRVGDELYLDGERFRAIGMNKVDLFWQYLGTVATGPVEAVAHIQDAARCGVGYVRISMSGFWAPSMDLYFDDPDEYFSRMDEMVDMCATNGVKLVPSLFWYIWCFPDIAQEHGDQFVNPDSLTRELMEDYITDVVTRYKDDPTILFWEVGNEYNLRADLDALLFGSRIVGAPHLGTIDELTAADSLTTDMINQICVWVAGVVKGIDSNHMVTTGHSIPRPSAWHLMLSFPTPDWTLDTKQQLNDYLALTHPDPIDIVSVHAYKTGANVRFEYTGSDNPSILGLLKGFTHDMGKPLYVGEFGDIDPYSGEDTSCAFSTNEFDAMARFDIPLAGPWSWDWYQFDPVDPTIFNIEPGLTDYLIARFQLTNDVMAAMPDSYVPPAPAGLAGADAGPKVAFFVEDAAQSLQGLDKADAAWAKYDDDGYPDLIVCGFDGIEPVTVLYHNNAGILEDSLQSIVDVQHGAVAWGDYDNDDDPDLAICGRTGAWTRDVVTKLYINTDGSLADSGQSLKGVDLADLAWADYDGDDDLDLVVAGYAREGNEGPVTILYENDDGTLVDSGQSLAGVYAAAVGWADYDGDDDPDLLVTGNDFNVASAVLYENDEGTLVDSGQVITPVFAGSVAWCDYDGDGDADVAVSGRTGPDVGDYATTLYRNTGGALSATSDTFVGAAFGGLSWMDYNKDARPDLLLSGFSENGVPVTLVYENFVGGFALSGEALPGVFDGVAVPGDYDDDGDDDLAVIGSDSAAGPQVYASVYTNVYGGIIVTYPNGGEFWPAGAERTITWTSGGEGDVAIELYKGGAFDSTIAAASENDGAFTWLIPEGIAGGSDYRVKITSTADGDIHDSSDGDFSISSLRLRMTGISWSNANQVAMVTFEGSKPVRRYYYRLWQTQSGYSSTSSAFAVFPDLGEGYYLVVVTARGADGVMAAEPARVWFYNRPLGVAFQVYLESYVIDHDAITFDVAANEDVSRYYVRLYGVESTYSRSDGSTTYNSLTDGMYYFVATGKETGTGSFPPVGPARQFFYIDTSGF